MPIFDSFNYQNSEILVWKIEENEDELLRLFSLHSNEKLEYSTIIRENTRKQRISSRLVAATLCKKMNLNYDDIFKDEFDKPHFKNSDFNISISHTANFAATIISKLNVGIDIEFVSDKIQRIKHKFCNLSELEKHTSSEELIRIWGAKESMYKAYGRKQLLFAEEMSVENNSGKVKRDGKTYHFSIFTKYYNDVCLVLAEEKN